MGGCREHEISIKVNSGAKLSLNYRLLFIFKLRSGPSHVAISVGIGCLGSNCTVRGKIVHYLSTEKGLSMAEIAGT